MNSKGTVFILTLVFAVMIFMAGMLFLNFVRDDITTAKDSLGCTDSTISDGAKVTCLVVGFVIPYGIMSVISLAGGLVLSRLLI